MPYTACHAALCRRTIAPHLRLPCSVRPIRLILSYFLLRVSESPHCSARPSPELCKDGRLVFIPLRFALGVSPSAAESNERTGDNRGRYQPVPTFIHPFIKRSLCILCPISLRTHHISEELSKRRGRTHYENAKRAAESRMNR